MFTFVFVLINEPNQQDMVTFFHLQQKDQLIAFPEPDSDPFFPPLFLFCHRQFFFKITK